MVLMPLKRVDPFVIRVDNTTGLVDVVPVYAGQAQMPEAVTRYFLDHYVTVCERFNFATAESDYEECGAFHTRRAQPGVVCGLGQDQSELAAECLQGWDHGARRGHLRQLLYPLQRRGRSGPGALPQGHRGPRAERRSG